MPQWLLQSLFNPFAKSSWWHLDKHLLEVWMRTTTFTSECKTSSGFLKLQDQTLPASKPSPSDTAAAVASSFSLNDGPWVVFHQQDWGGYQTPLLRLTGWWDGSAGLGAALELAQVGSLMFSCWAGIICGRKVWAGSVGSTSLAQCKPPWYQDPITQKAGSVLHFFPRKSIFSPFNLIPGAFHCTE